MATQLFCRELSTNRIGDFRNLSTSRGVRSKECATASTASGTQIQWTFARPLEWISGRSPAGGWTLSGTVTVNLRARESSMNANCGGRIRLFKRTAAGSESEVGGGPWDDGVEFGTSDAAMNWTFTPTSTSFSEDDRLIVRFYITNVGTMAAFSITMSYDGPSAAAAGDTYVTINETVAFKDEDLPYDIFWHFEGSDGSTSFPVSSDSDPTDGSNLHGNLAAIGGGNNQVDTAQFKFGSASELAPGNASWHYLQPSDADDRNHARWSFGRGFPWTIDVWHRCQTLRARTLISFAASGIGNCLTVETDSSGIMKVYNGTPSETVLITAGSALSTNTWQHIALTQDSSNNLRLFIDGTQTGSTADASSIDWTMVQSGTLPNILSNAPGFTSGVDDGWWDEFRVRFGEAVWTANFTPPTEDYPLTATSDGAGSAAGTGTASGVGAATAASTASAAGTGTAIATGAATAAASGSAAGTGTATATGTGINSAVGAAAGTGAAAATGEALTLAASTGSASGAGAAAAVGAATAAATASAAGTGAAAATGASTAAATATAAGTGVATGQIGLQGVASGTGAASAVGESITGATEITGSASGTGTASGQAGSQGVASGTGTAAGVAEAGTAVGAASGTGTAAAVGTGITAIAGAAAGTGAAAGVGRSTNAAAGSAAGAGTATGTIIAFHARTGSASGTGAAAATGAATAASTGSAAGTGTAAAVGTGIKATVGSAAGTGQAAGIAATGTAVGTATGTGTAAALSEAITAAVGAASGTGTAAAVGVDSSAAVPPQEGAGGVITGGTFSRGRWRKLKDEWEAARLAQEAAERRAQEVTGKRRQVLAAAAKAAEEAIQAAAQAEEQYAAEAAKLASLLEDAAKAKALSDVVRRANAARNYALQIQAEMDDEEEAIRLLLVA